ncbi:MAG: nickel pincer cofactor biosynthesis protein LarC [Candidatus Thorarchaeota archaeon]|nr:nickel pincer cofactor biosynthesis protein LarC [Candidatus Thorarchaeota archaeon]
MTKKTVLIDVATAGASGDMFLSALTDLIGEDDALLPVAASLLIYDPSFRLNMRSHTHSGLTGRQIQITQNHGIRLTPASIVNVLRSVAEEVELSVAGKKIAERALNELLEAESRAHNKPIDELHLHETGTVDTVLDIVGTAYLLERTGLLGEAEFLATSVAVGKGTIKTEHGLLEVPVPAVAEMLVANDVPYHNGDAKTEVLTPTGAAILIAITDRFVKSHDDFVAQNQGFGFGTRDLGEIPNMMSIVIGETIVPEDEVSKPVKEELTPKETPPPEKTKTKPKPEEKPKLLDDWNEDEVIVIETNVDDVDGETLGTLFDTLLAEGLAYDVTIIPAIGKKNRPCYVVKVIAAKAGLRSIADVMVKNLGTIGIRYTTWQRLKASRETIVCSFEIDGKEYMVRVKVSRNVDGSILNIKPEADDVLRVSKETGIPVRELRPRIAMQAHAVTE